MSKSLLDQLRAKYPARKKLDEVNSPGSEPSK
jgi:hypothetical protein